MISWKKILLDEFLLDLNKTWDEFLDAIEVRTGVNRDTFDLYNKSDEDNDEKLNDLIPGDRRLIDAAGHFYAESGNASMPTTILNIGMDRKILNKGSIIPLKKGKMQNIQLGNKRFVSNMY